VDFITAENVADNILTCRDADIAYANDYLHRLAHGFGLDDGDIKLPAREVVKRLGSAIACRECAASMVGSDATVMVDGSRSEDIYLQKYKVYADLAKNIEKGMTYEDFAITGVDSSGKGGVGVIRLSRA
jgi:hypothetical protein